MKILLTLLVLLWSLLHAWVWNCKLRPTTNCFSAASIVALKPKLPTPPPIEAKPVEEEAFKPITIYFNLNQSEVISTPEIENYITTAKKILTDSSKIYIASGHTDSDGPDDLNITLSRERALRVKNFLVSKGMKGANIEIKAEGEAKPITANDTPENKKFNRRVVVELKK